MFTLGRRIGLISFVFLVLAKVATAQIWTPIDENWEFWIGYEGEDIAVVYTLDTQTNQVVATTIQKTWPEVIEASTALHCTSGNALTSPYWISKGKVTLHIRYRHSAPPSFVGLKIQSPAIASATGANKVLDVEGGLGIDPWALNQNTLYTGGNRLRIISLTSGEGQMEFEKEAKAMMTGDGVLKARCIDLHFSIDDRMVNIVSQNGGATPSVPTGFIPKTLMISATQDLFEWYAPLDTSYQNRPLQYTELLPGPPQLIQTNFASNYAVWYIGMPIEGQIKRVRENGTTYEPSSVPDFVSQYHGVINGGSPGEPYEWDGYSGFSSGSLTSEPSELLPYSGEHASPAVLVTLTYNESDRLTSREEEFNVNDAQGVWNLKLTHYFHDGTIGTSIRDIYVKPRSMPGSAQSPTYMDFNVGSTAASTEYKSTKIVDPVTHEESNIWPYTEGWVPGSEQWALFRELDSGYESFKSVRFTVTMVWAILQTTGLPVWDTLMAMASVPGMDSLESESPSMFSKVIGRDEYYGISVIHRYCDYLKVNLPGLTGEATFENPNALMALKQALTQQNLYNSYWKVEVRPYYDMSVRENLVFSPLGFESQTFDKKFTKRLHSGDMFRRFYFSSHPY